MKIALVIFRFGPSHGSILQTYALTRMLESMGHHVTIIDRQRPIRSLDYKNMVVRIFTNIKKGTFSWSDFYVGAYPPIWMKHLNVFIDKEIRKQTITVREQEDLVKIGEDSYDAYIVGSDQTWRPKYVYNIFNYFLDFVPQNRKVRRIAYAPSFGTPNWEYNKEQELLCKELLSCFDGVSVREDDGIHLCKTYFNRDAELVLDPTMLLKASDYEKYIIRSNNTDFVGCNFLDYDSTKTVLAEKVSNFLGIPSRSLITMGDGKKTTKARIAPSIEDWLSGIANSKFLLVDSFHATVFCILFHKNFLTVANVDRGISRFTSLLKITGLEERLVTTEDISENLLLKPINWSDVDKRLSKMRDSSISFLKRYLKNS